MRDRKKIPFQLWCQILPHAEHQLNLLQKSRVVPKISAFAHMYGKHDYETQPFAPLVCGVEIHVMPSVRETWKSHTKTGYYLGTSWEHYRCHKVWIQETKSTQVVQTVFFKRKYLTQPTITAPDALVREGDNICNTLANIAPETEKTRRAIDFLMDIFKSQARKNESGTDTQRVCTEAARARRVVVDEAEQTIYVLLEEIMMDNDDLRTTKYLEVLLQATQEH